MKSNFDKCLAMLLGTRRGLHADKRDKGNAGMDMEPRSTCLVSLKSVYADWTGRASDQEKS